MEPNARTVAPEELLAHAGWVRALARRLLRDESRVDDVLQQTWMAAVEKGPSNPKALPGWLATVARNFALRSKQAESRRARREEATAQAEAVEATADVVERGEALSGVVQAVMELPDPVRSVLLHHYFDELKPKQIAQLMRLPESRVRTLLKTGRDLLRERLDRRYGDWRQPCLALASVPTVVATGGGATAWLGSKALGVVAAVLVVAVAAPLLLVGDEPLPDPPPGVDHAGPSLRLPGQRAVDLPPPAAGPARQGLRVDPDFLAGLEEAGREQFTVRLHAFDAREGGPVDGLGLEARWTRTDGELGEQSVPLETDGAGGARFSVPRSADTVALALDEGEPWATIGPSWDISIGADGESLEVGMPVIRAGRLRGRLVDARGEPISRVPVLITRRQGWLHNEALRLEDHPRVRTDEDGRFEIDSLLGTGRLHAFLPDGLELAAVMQVGPGETLERTWKLPASNGAESLEVSVHGPEGEPVAGAAVQLLARDWRLSGEELTPLGFRGRTDAAGRLQVDRLAPPEGLPGHVLVQYPEHAVATSRWSRGQRFLSVRLEERPRLEGVVRGADGQPLAGAELAYWSPRLEGEALWSAQPDDWRSTRTDASGRFALEARSTRRGCLLVRAPGHAVHAITRLDPGDPGDWKDVRLEAESVFEGRVLGTGPSLAPDDLIVRLEGDRPLVGEESAAMRRAQGLRVPTPENFFAEWRHPVDAQGRFRIDGLYDGLFQITVHRRGDDRPLARVVRAPRPAGAGGDPFTIRLGEGLEPTVELHGEVVDARTGESVRAFRTWLRARDGRRTLSTSAEQATHEGRFALEGLQPGVWGLEIQAEGYATWSFPLRELAAGRHELRAELHPATRAAFEIVDPTGAPLPEVLVELRVDGERIAQGLARTDDGGRVVFEAAPATWVDVVVSPRRDGDRAGHTQAFDLSRPAPGGAPRRVEAPRAD